MNGVIVEDARLDIGRCGSRPPRMAGPDLTFMGTRERVTEPTFARGTIRFPLDELSGWRSKRPTFFLSSEQDTAREREKKRQR